MDKHIQERLARLDADAARYGKKIRIALLKELDYLLELVKHGVSAELVAASVSSKWLKPVLHDLYLNIIQREARYEYKYLLATYGTERKALPVPVVTEWLRRARNFISIESSRAIVAITSTTRNLVKRTLKESLLAGDSIPVTAKNMRAAVTQFSTKRAVKIARTELINSGNHAAYIGAITTGLKLNKKWLATDGGRTRDTHRVANGQIVDINAMFLVGGEQALYPGSTALSARERINCRCCVTFSPKPKAGIQTSLDF